jgi:DNA-directed RNA polymerase III subunit RPC2
VPSEQDCGCSHVTTDEETEPIVRTAFNLGVEASKRCFSDPRAISRAWQALMHLLCSVMQDINLLSGGEINRRSSFVVFINGLVLGIHSQPYTFVSELRSLRRSGRLGEFVAIHIDEKQRCIYISADSGRVCRPLIIVKNGQPLISTRHIRELELGLRSFGDLIIEGRIEYDLAYRPGPPDVPITRSNIRTALRRHGWGSDSGHGHTV